VSNRSLSAINVARDYYNSGDADNFYSTIWGGEDIHVGIYASEDEGIFEASRRTVERMAARLDGLAPESRVLDLGSGYAGPARYLAKTYGSRVVALNLSEVENERGRALNEEQGMDHLVEVVDGSYEDIPYPEESFDVVWSQDAILHSGERERVLEETARVLKPGGDFVFTDPMQSDDCPESVLEPILDRIHLDSLGSPDFYRRTAERVGLREVGFEDHSEQIPNHYHRVLQETEAREEELSRLVSGEYIERMKRGLVHWIEGGRNCYLTWGIFHFRS
jgi:sarcosine/dimethylglycine N-methyltransferase